MIINEYKDFILLIFGWSLGLLSPIVTSAIQDKRKTKSIKTALLTELRELQYRLMLMIYSIESKYGKLDHDFFEWAQSILVGYVGVNSSDSLLKTIGPLLKLSNEEMDTYVQYAKLNRKSNSGLSLKKCFVSLLEANPLSLEQFDTILQSQLLEIKTRLGFMNETVDESRYYFKLSFQGDITSENHQIANINMIDSYKIYGAQAKIVANIIGKILTKN